MDYPPKYPRTLHLPCSPTIHADDRTHRDPSIFVGRDIVITEKLDGGNTCLWNGEVYARSTSQPSRAGWMAMVRKHHAWKTVGKDTRIIIYGEDMYGVHSIEYDALPEDETFRMFAIRMGDGSDDDYFLSWNTVTTYDSLKAVPTVFTGRVDTLDQLNAMLDAAILIPSGLGGEREGFVIRIADSFRASEFSTHVAKYVRANHVQTDQHWSRNWKSCQIQ